MSGSHNAAKLRCGCPLDGRVGRHFRADTIASLGAKAETLLGAVSQECYGGRIAMEATNAARFGLPVLILRVAPRSQGG